jgi:hypothetical protein
LETFAIAYESGQSYPPSFALAFPDLKKTKILRLNLQTSVEEEIAVNLEEILKSGDCSKDIWLQWGDIIEIPEADHRINESWNGFSKELLESLPNCLARKVTVAFKGETKTVSLLPTLKIIGGSGIGAQEVRFYALEKATFWLNPVVYNSGLLRTSSDPDRVKVRRIDPVSKETKEMIFNSRMGPLGDLWLCDGDQIEIPERDLNVPSATSGSSRSVPTRPLKLPANPNLPVPPN